MKVALVTLFLSAVVAGLSGHLVIVSWFPQVMAEYYPEKVARIYVASVAPNEGASTVRLESVAGRPGIKRVVLNPAAVERLGIETAAIVEKGVSKTRTITGSVLAGSALLGDVKAATSGNVVVVRVPLGEVDGTFALDKSAMVYPVAAGEKLNAAAGVSATPIGVVTEADGIAKQRIAYYIINGIGHGLQPGSTVKVKVPLPDTGDLTKVIPAAAVLYDPRGRTWAYTNPEPLVYVRQPLKIVSLNADSAILSDGPPAGAMVVIVGAFELFGAESRIGH